jgi:hypothetical protein
VLTVLIDGLAVEVEGLVCEPMPSSGGNVDVRFHTAAMVGLPQGQGVMLAFDIGGTLYHGLFRLSGFTIRPGRCDYEFSSVGPVIPMPP